VKEAISVAAPPAAAREHEAETNRRSRLLPAAIASALLLSLAAAVFTAIVATREPQVVVKVVKVAPPLPRVEDPREPAARPAPSTPAAPKAAEPHRKPHAAKPRLQRRTPDFIVPGAPAEPTDEMSLVARARMIERRVKTMKPTDEAVSWWLYQHNWVVTGALFGWHDGDQALRILVRADKIIQRRFDIGYRSEQRAQTALARVLAHH
jgi:hypothetical protein